MKLFAIGDYVWNSRTNTVCIVKGYEPTPDDSLVIIEHTQCGLSTRGFTSVPDCMCQEDYLTYQSNLLPLTHGLVPSFIRDWLTAWQEAITEDAIRTENAKDLFTVTLTRADGYQFNYGANSHFECKDTITRCMAILMQGETLSIKQNRSSL